MKKLFCSRINPLITEIYQLYTNKIYKSLRPNSDSSLKVGVNYLDMVVYGSIFKIRLAVYHV